MEKYYYLKDIMFDPNANKDDRLSALTDIYRMHCEGLLDMPETKEFVNNHIHTCYSFSPYTPCAALYTAWLSGLKTAGIMDHDSVGGAYEFIEAGKILGMPVTVGCEVRVSLTSTEFEGKRLNNPDQISCAYVAMHGIPHQNIEKVEAVLRTKRIARNLRNAAMCDKINELCSPYGIELSFEQDVCPLSKRNDGGSITERHVLYALTNMICDIYHDRKEAVSFIEKLQGKMLADKKKQDLLEAPEKFYKYDLLGIMKSGLIEKIYIDADDELLHITEFVKLAREVGAISAYAYLGDVGDSPTGDKKAQKFEDDYLDSLVSYLSKIGFNAITYMPSRNTMEQLERIMSLCEANNFFQISGEDINSPRQSFICPAAEAPEFSHLKKATYALIGHEICATGNMDNSMFSTASEEKSLKERIEYYAVKGGYINK